jgi:hypothetical protein
MPENNPESNTRTAADGNSYNVNDMYLDPETGWEPHQGAVPVPPKETETRMAADGKEYNTSDLHYNLEDGTYEPHNNANPISTPEVPEPKVDEIIPPIKHDVSITEALRSQDVIQQLARENEELRRENQELKRRLNPYNSEDELQAALDPNRRRDPDYLQQVMMATLKEGNRRQEQFVDDQKKEDVIHNPLNVNQDPRDRARNELRAYGQELEFGRDLTAKEMKAIFDQRIAALVAQGKDPAIAYQLVFNQLSSSRDEHNNINSKILSAEERSLLVRNFQQEQVAAEKEKKEIVRIDPTETQRAKLTLKVLLLRGAEWTGTQIARASLALVEFMGNNRTNHIKEKLEKETDPAKRKSLEYSLANWEEVYDQVDMARSILGLPVRNKQKKV